MARFSGRTALRAALGGFTGAMEGFAARDQAARIEREREAERQRMLRAEERQLIAAGYRPEGASLDMPGATPRPTPFHRQKVGDQTYALQEDPNTVALRGALHQALKEQNVEDQKIQSRIPEAMTALDLPKNMSEQERLNAARFFLRTGKSPYEKLTNAQQQELALRSRERALTPAQALEMQRELNEAEAWWNANVTKNRATESPEAASIVAAYNRMRTANRNMPPQEIMLSLYRSQPRKQTGGSGGDGLAQYLNNSGVLTPGSAQGNSQQSNLSYEEFQRQRQGR